MDFSTIEHRLHYTFRDRAWLGRSLTHRSWAHEQVAPGAEAHVRALHNEALEFVGDSVLGLVVADYLFRMHPEVTEGELSRMKHSLVSAATLAKAAQRLELGRFLRIGRGEEKTGGRGKNALLADAFEAVLAAIFLDGGLEAATAFLLYALGPELQAASPADAASEDYKTKLQEALQGRRQTAPRYRVVATEGPPHQRVFHVEVVWEDGSAQAAGSAIKAAEMEAARLALALLGEK
jgi:ribonuclease-3